MDVQFYKCEHCGNITIKVTDKGPGLSCCGHPMTLLAADSTDAAVEKHVPEVKVDGHTLHVNVGSVDHPMTPEHYIEFICVVTEKGYDIHPLMPTDAPHSDFAFNGDDAPVRVYAYCNIHGLWVKDVA